MSRVRLGGRSDVAEPYPLEAATDTRGPQTLNVTASGDTQVIANADATASLVITNLWLSNRNSAAITVALKEGAGGTERWKGLLAADGGGYVAAFHPHWKLAAGTDLTINLSATGNVDVNTQFYLI